MATAVLYNSAGETKGDITLNDEIFGVTPKDALIHQVYEAQRANKRQPWAHTKDRGEVRGGGKKPWKQKGTGRARHGSTRSPIWVGGGITFGPRNVRNYVQKINKKMKKIATVMCLSSKVAHNRFIVVETIETTGKTKEVANLWKKLPGYNRSTLFIVDDMENTNLLLAMRNIPKLAVVRAEDVSVMELLNHQYVLVTKKGIEKFEQRFS